MDKKEKMTFFNSISSKILLLVIVVVTVSLGVSMFLADSIASGVVGNVNENYILSLAESAADAIENISNDDDYIQECSEIVKEISMEGISSAYGYLVDADGTLMCADKSRNIGKKLEEDWYKNIAKKPDGRYQITGSGKTYTVLSQNLSYLGCHMYGVIDNEMAIQDLYNMPLLILICAVTAVFIMLLCLFYLQKTLHPLSNLVSKMAISRRKEFREYIPVEGTCEVQQLASTYNEMLDDIQNYIGELLDTQRAQRKAEIKALQMQINPHYIYNTLASIKWLVYQNDTEKTTRTIDAFISLLRNTISNTDEMVSVEQELVNIENYILINHTRYGDQIRVEYEIQPDCYNCNLPKLVLQPFVENAFFHGFPSGEQGTICVRMRRVMIDETNEVLEVQVADDGVGMETGDPKKIVKNRKEHFSGIGVQNVQERLALIYGKREEPDFYIHIDSVPGHGTTVRIRIPNI